MSEIVTTYLLDDLDQPMPMGRDEFYDSQIECAKKGEKPNRAVAIIDVLLFTLDGEVIIQKRSSNKRHNAGLLDKSLGGHITFGDTPDFTVMTETLQELEIAAIVLDSEEDFKKTFRLLRNHLKNTALLQFVESKTMKLEKKFNELEKEVPILQKYYFYLGVYNGSIKPADKEATGVLFYKLDQLNKELKTNPSSFTLDLKYFVDKYSNKIEKFLADIK